MSSKKYIPVFCGLMLGLSSLFSSAATQSQPMFYTFSGNVSDISDSGGLASDAGVSVGDFVSYIFEIDTSADAIVTWYNGDHAVPPDFQTGEISVDRFFVDYVSGSLLQAGNFFGDPTSNIYWDGRIAMSNFGSSSSNDSTSTYETALRTGSSDHQLAVLYSGDSDYGINSEWQLTERAFSSSGIGTLVSSSVYLSSISDRNPSKVPELDGTGAPIAFALISGLLGLALERRTRKT